MFLIPFLNWFESQLSVWVALSPPYDLADAEHARKQAGCVNVPKAGRLCEHTIQTMPTPTSPAYFEVLDLTKDKRFNTLPFVTAEPFFKYYCGVPLRTKNGIAIGSLFALDDKVRAPISEANKACKILLLIAY